MLGTDEGAGIYRHVYLVGTGATHIEQDGVFAPATVTSEIERAENEQAVRYNSGGLSADATVHASATVVGPAGMQSKSEDSVGGVCSPCVGHTCRTNPLSKSARP